VDLKKQYEPRLQQLAEKIGKNSPPLGRTVAKDAALELMSAFDPKQPSAWKAF
jgi:hypothetical protein